MELLIALSITAMLLTATMMATVASFDAYAMAVQSASTQTTTRLVIYRLLSMIRTSTVQAPLLDPDNPSATDDVIESSYIEVLDANGDLVKVSYQADTQELWVTTTPFGTNTPQSQPLLGGVTSAKFYLRRRLDNEGVYVLERATIDLTVQPDDDSTMQMEKHAASPIHVVASTIPRRLQSL